MRHLLALCCATALWLLPRPSFALCEPLLEVVAPSQPRLAVNACEVRLTSGPAVDGRLLSLQLQGDAALRWSSALALRDEGGGLGGELLAGRAVVRTPLFGSGLPDGLFLWSSSARLVEPPSWRWYPPATLVLQAPLPGPATAAACAVATRGALVLWLGVRDVAPGQLLATGVFVSPNAHTFEPLPRHCSVLWELEAGAPALLPDARVGVLMVQPDAPTGRFFTLRARLGTQMIEGQARVVRPSRDSLVGSWHQISEATCARHLLRAPLDAVQELRLDRDGVFSMTWGAPASRPDVAGRYALDDAGVVTFSIEHGAQQGTAAKAHVYVTDAGRLELIDWDPGSRPGTPPAPREPLCELWFQR